MGDLEEAEAGKGCREEKIHMDSIRPVNDTVNNKIALRIYHTQLKIV